MSGEGGLFTLEEAVHKMTHQPAAKLKLKERGIVAEGMFADLVIFDRNKIRDNADYRSPRRPPSGISHVLIEGIPAIKNGLLTGQKAGRFLLATTD